MSPAAAKNSDSKPLTLHLPHDASLLLSDPLDWTASLRCSFVQYCRIVRHPHGHRFPLEAEIAFGYDAC